MGMETQKLIFLYAALLLLLTIPACCGENIPPNIGELIDDYYDVGGSPELSASIMGKSEFESGDSSTLFIRLTNNGSVDRFETDEVPRDAGEFTDARKELELEADVTTAVGILGTLENKQEAPLRILSGVREGRYLREGETSQPMEFEIEIYKNAPSGSYELTLNLRYQYQKEVQVTGHPEPEYNYWYAEKKQELPVYITIKPEADFEVVSSGFHPAAGGKCMLYITYKNTGDEVAEHAVSRIIEEDPFTFKDGEAFLGTLNPGDSYEAKYIIEVDEDALPKLYGIETEVEFRDSRGEQRVSEPLKAPFRMDEFLCEVEKGRLGPVGYYALAVGILATAGYYVYRKRKRKKWE